MSTVIYSSPIFGPVKSRRLGISLGINLLPADGKWCSFDCLYCECGLNAERKPKLPLPTREEVSKALESKLLEMQQEGALPDVLTFAGNGEPTMHPHFPEIVDDVIELRNKYCPKAKVSVLTNSTQIMKPRVFEALKQVDNNITKLDTVNPTYIYKVDRPQGNYDVEQIINRLKEFQGHCIIQTMFMEGEGVSNTSDDYVLPWLDKVCEIAPSMVMIYTVDRETPVEGLNKASHQTLDSIAERVRARGIECSVSY